MEEKWDKDLQSLSLPFSIIKEKEQIKELEGPLNAFFWINNKGLKRAIAIERKAHRPKEFFLPPPYRRAVSPGAIDMAGVIVTPYKEDFEKIEPKEILEIYRQVSR